MAALRRTMGLVALRTAAHLRGPLPPPHLESLAHPAPVRRPLPDLPPRRHLAAPPHLLKRNSKDDDDGDGDGNPRINAAITSPFVRLVTDQGHSVVPSHEALELAAKMEMDLVEVHRKSNPPVCKIMNFHKEKYKKEVKEKERLKTKSAIVLRGGDNKEVRFKGKTDLKDLMVKADAITRLMERGYRVKCMAIPSGNGEQDLQGPLERLLGLIQDVCFVESGPHYDSKHAYAIVKHVKFANKKGGKKVSKAIEDAGKGTSSTASKSPVAGNGSNEKTTECSSEADDQTILGHVDKTGSLFSEFSTQKGGDDRGFKSVLNGLEPNPGANNRTLHNTKSGGNRINLGQWVPQTSDMEKQEINKQDREPGETNRYAAQRQPVRGSNQSLSHGRFPQDHRRNGNEGRYSGNDNQRPVEQHTQPLPRFNEGRVPQDLRNERRGDFALNNNQKQPAGSDPGSPNPKAKSFGIFSTPKPASPELRKTNGACTSKPDNPELPKSYGIFGSSRRESGN